MVEQIRFHSDNYNAGNIGDFDNLVVETLNPPQADQVGYRPINWIEFLRIDNVRHAGTTAHGDASYFSSNQALYFNLALLTGCPELMSSLPK